MTLHIKKATIHLIAFFAFPSVLMAQEPVDIEMYRELDSLLAVHERLKSFPVAEEWKPKFEYMDGLRHLVKGLVLSKSQQNFYNHKAKFESRDFGKEDYAVALTPLAVNYALRAAGVESKSKWNRMLTANAISLAMHVGVVEGLKKAVSEQRPNAENSESFPSGHTSLAFLSATILSHEYGHYSPWVTLGAYGCATGTQFLRMRHNNHWVNDTFVGAGIGVMSANLGYYIADCIYGKQGLSKGGVSDIVYNQKFVDNASGFKLLTGTETGDKSIGSEHLTMHTPYDGEVSIKTGAAFTVGVDMNYALNEFCGLEASARMSTAHAKVYATAPLNGEMPQFTGGSMSFYHFNVASYCRIPDIKRSIGSRILAGVRNTQSLELSTYSYTQDGSISYTPFAGVGGSTCFEIGCSMFVDMISTRNSSVGFVFDYYHAFTKFLPNRMAVLSSWKAYF